MLLVGFLSILHGCGGSSGTTSADNNGTSGTNGMISGMAIKGPVSGATVTAYSIANGMMGSQVTNTTTDSTGSFLLSMGTYSGSVMLQMSGGTYVDEATGMPMTMASGNVMTAVIPSVVSGSTITGIQMTPLTSMSQSMASNMAGGMTGANIVAANASVGAYFMVNDILHTQPMNPLVSGSSGTATQDMKNYGMTIAAMSQTAKDMGMTSSSGMVTAMMNDATDGVMNGMMGGTLISMGGMGGGMMGGGGAMMQVTAGTSGLATAMSAFMASPMNKSGLTAADMLTLMTHLNASNGTL